jgi:hypothetical protein
MSQFCEVCVWCKDGKTCANVGLRIDFIRDQQVIQDLCFRSKYGSTSIIDDYKKENNINDTTNNLP